MSMTFKQLIENVKHFHDTIVKCDIDQRTDAFLNEYGHFAKGPLFANTRGRGYRICHRGEFRLDLLKEELSELEEGIHSGDQIKVADALGDLLYVLVGTAIEFDIPLEEVFNEVHRSNMTKLPRQPDDIKGRIRDKGHAYVPPDLASVLSTYDKESR